MALLKKKSKVEYTFQDYCKKQIAYFTACLDSSDNKEDRDSFERFISKYELMILEYNRYQKEIEYLERKAKYES